MYRALAVIGSAFASASTGPDLKDWVVDDFDMQESAKASIASPFVATSVTAEDVDDTWAGSNRSDWADDTSSTGSSTTDEDGFATIEDPHAWVSDAQEFLMEGKPEAPESSQPSLPSPPEPPQLMSPTSVGDVDAASVPITKPVLKTTLQLVQDILDSSSTNPTEETVVRFIRLMEMHPHFSPTLATVPAALLDVFIAKRNDPRSSTVLVYTVVMCAISAKTLAKQLSAPDQKPLATLLASFGKALPGTASASRDFYCWLHELKLVIKKARADLSYASEMTSEVAFIVASLQEIMRRVRNFAKEILPPGRKRQLRH